MIRIKGLDKEFDRQYKEDISFRYVVDHPKLKRSVYVPEKYLGTNKDSSPRTQKEFRIFASEVRLWVKRLKDKFMADEAEKKLVQQEIAKALRLQLIKIKDAERQGKEALTAVRIEMIRHQVQVNKKRPQAKKYHVGQVIPFTKPDGTVFREVVAEPSRELARV